MKNTLKNAFLNDRLHWHYFVIIFLYMVLKYRKSLLNQTHRPIPKNSHNAPVVWAARYILYVYLRCGTLVQC